MARSEVQICNMALGRIGISQEISSLDEASNEAIQCKRFYEETRDRVLQEAPWRAATRRQELADVSDPPAGWAYRYRYPNNCLQARSIVNPLSRIPAADQRIPFAVMEDEESAGLCIVTDEPNAVLEYTKAISDPKLFSALLTSAIAWALAAELVAPLKADVKWRSDAEQHYLMQINQAFALSMNEGQEDQPPDSEFIRARG